jgi:hypothetical protein
MPRKYFLGLAVLAAAVLMPLSFVSAHLDGGKDVTVGGHLIDFGWDPEQLVAGKPSKIALNLVDAAKEEAVDFDNVWVRITSPRGVIFAATLRPETKNVTFTYVFPEGGDHEMTARFRNAFGGTVVETKLPFSVAADPANTAQAAVPEHSDRAIRSVLAFEIFVGIIGFALLLL